MSFPFSDVVLLSVFAAAVSAGITTWWWLSQRTRNIEYALEPLTAIMRIAPEPANEVIEECAPDSSVRLRIGAKARAVDSN